MSLCRNQIDLSLWNVVIKFGSFASKVKERGESGVAECSDDHVNLWIDRKLLEILISFICDIFLHAKHALQHRLKSIFFVVKVEGCDEDAVNDESRNEENCDFVKQTDTISQELVSMATIDESTQYMYLSILFFYLKIHLQNSMPTLNFIF